MWREFLCVAVTAALLCGPAAAADHPGSASDCGDCHQLQKGDPGAPKVSPQAAGFWARLFGKGQAPGGHASLSCVGSAEGGGNPTGCHRPEAGFRDFLVVDLAGKPVDELCGACHAAQRAPGGHHPSYLADRDRDGVAESVVRPATGQEIYSAYAPASLPAPLPRHPDALVFTTRPDGARVREVALPLETVQVVQDGQTVTVSDVTTCSTCHNPHYGYLVEAGTEEELNRDLAAREKGDALLRLRDLDNALCDACH